MIDVPYEVKKVLREGTYRKNYRFIVLHDDWTEDFTIANDNLIKESVSIDERMCSGDTIKYGLCEGSSLEFQYFEKPNITGRRVQAFVDVDYKKVITQYSWETQEQFSTAFTVTDMSGDCRLYTELDSAWDFVYVTENGTTTQVYPTATESGTIIELGDVTGRTLIVSLPVIPAPTADLQLLVPHEVPTIFTHTIPMGFFEVKKCSRQASTGIIKATAYNKLQSDYLDQKVNSMIEDIIAQGEDGLSDASIYYVLKELLQVYSVNTYDEEESVAHPYYGVLSFNGTSILADDGSGHEDGYYNVFYISRYYTNDSFSSSKYYRFTANTHGIKELVHTIFDGKYRRAYDEEHGDHTEPLITAIDDTYYIGFTYIRDHHYVTPLETFLYLKDDVPENISSNIHTNIDRGVAMEIPVLITHTASPDTNITDAIRNQMRAVLEAWDEECGNFATLYEIELSPLEQMRWSNFDDMADVTLRELQSAVYETSCQFGQLSRTTDLFSGVELGHSRLLPAETLYPATDLYPGGARLSGSKAMYSKLWADEGNIHKWRYLIITYKGLDDEGNEQDYTLQRTVNNDGTDNYNCSDNWLFRNLVWTAEQIGEYADAMVAKMQGITWFPFEMWCAGLPYLETGDEIEIPLGDQKYVSYVLQRQLKGIQNLQDTYINGTLDIY